MPATETRELEVPQEVAAGRKQDVRNWEPPISVQLAIDLGDEEGDYGDYAYGYEYGAGSWIGRLRIEVSLDGVRWTLPGNTDLQDVTTIPHPTVENIDEPVNWIRVNVLEYTSGDAEVRISGRRKMGA